MSASCDIGVTGLATMGANLARNAARKGFSVALHNRTASVTDQLVKEFGSEGTFVPAHDSAAFVAALRPPRAILMMVKAGKPVDDVIAELVPHLDAGDILIDGGNSLFTDTRRRERELGAKGFQFLGVGISGGEEGALEGPSMMPGGHRDAYERVRPIFERMAAQVDGAPCCAYLGTDGAGHYVKMVHNGIEYAVMQMIAESYALMTQLFGYDAARLATVFANWKEGDLASYLVDITATVLAKVDASTGKALVDVISDEAEQKGTGRWTAEQAMDLGIPVTTIGEAVFARSLSALKPERESAAAAFADVVKPPAPDPAPDEWAAHDALYASTLVAYAQGFSQLAAASKEFGWNLDLATIATIWRGGCIIRAAFLDKIKTAYEGRSGDTNLLLVPHFRDAIARAEPAWRRIVVRGIDRGVAMPASSSALAYFDGLRTARGSANLIQGLRDFFGSHTYERIDKSGSYHVRWSQDGAEVKTAG